MFSFATYEDDCQNEPHFLDACFLCRKSLGNNSDIFMYRYLIGEQFMTQFLKFQSVSNPVYKFVFFLFFGQNLIGINWNFYRGNTPFCSKDCRQEQIEFDEAKEKSLKVSSSSSSSSSSRAAHRKSDANKNSTPNKTVRTGTVAVAWLVLIKGLIL